LFRRFSFPEIGFRIYCQNVDPGAINAGTKTIRKTIETSVSAYIQNHARILLPFPVFDRKYAVLPGTPDATEDDG
jgi:hypothetical protein